MVAGVVILVLTLALALYYFLRRRRSAARSETMAPYDVTPRPFGGKGSTIRNSSQGYSLNTVVDRVQRPLSEQPVEAGLMSRSAGPRSEVSGSGRTIWTSVVDS